MTILDMIGNTPLVKVHEAEDVWMKLEGFNPFGSIKDRAAAYIIEKGLAHGFINKEAGIVESSSGNFAIALAGICNIKNIKFTCVIDPMITNINRRILEIYGADVRMVNVSDENGSYVGERIRLVKNIVDSEKDIYWPNQYDNPLVCEAYEETLVKELNEKGKLDYIFMAVSTCGTIAGISQGLKKVNSNVKIIAVDVEGSKIFQNIKGTKLITGIGSSFRPNNLEHALMDDICIMNTKVAVQGCKYLLSKGIFAGGSSGAVLAAYQNYCLNHDIKGKKVICILPDRGERYIDTIYNEKWLKDNQLD